MNQFIGTEKFTFNGNDTGTSILDFWSWAYSDILNNTSRGVLAEFLVQSSLSSTPTSKSRIDWAPFDLTSPSGRRIEVKSAAYLQSWEQDYYSKILFDIAPKRAWNPKKGYAIEKKRTSDLYVFCLYTSLSKEESMLNLNLWDFYVLSTYVLNNKKPDQKSLSISSLLRLKPIKTDYSNLKKTIETIPLRQ